MIETDELKKLNKELAKISKELMQVVKDTPPGVTQELAVWANTIRNHIIESMSRGTKTGRKYTRGKKDHRASAPGEAPAVDSGELISRIIFDVRDMEVEIGPEIGGSSGDQEKSYAYYLEFGTPEGQMEPRPYLAPAVKEYESDMLKAVGDKIIDIVKKGFPE
jgi:hypothetical protein